MRFIIIALLYNAIFLSLFPDRLLRGIAAPTKNQPCNFAKYVVGDIPPPYAPVPIDEVRTCLTSFPYDAKNAKAIINTITKTLTGYYVFLDSARDPPEKGNTYNAINVVDSLKKLLKNDFDTDYDFVQNVTKILDQLKDAHTSLHPECYRTFIFLQGIDLYSVVKDGQQSIKVWKDFLDDKNDDCDVLEIDGVPALSAIKQYAEEHIGLARDLGVRFNIALNSLSVYGPSEFSNFFSRRQYLPPSNEITYRLQCSGKEKNVVRKWTACGDTFSMVAVTNNETYSIRNCHSIDVGRSNTRPSYRRLSTGLTTQRQQSTSSKADDNICRTVFDPPTVTLNNGKLVEGRPDTVVQFYILPEQNTGVLVLGQVLILSDAILVEGFQKFIDKGVKKVIIDLTNNVGGNIVGAHILNNVLFPETDPSFDTDFRVSDLMRLSIQKSSDQNLITYPGNWLNPKTKKPFTDAKSFIDNHTYTRGGVSENYTSHFIDSQQFSSKKKLPWKATDYAILTNGFCGSSCSLIATHLAEENNLLTVSVGGFPNTPMAFASFTGGQVFSLDDILDELDDLDLSNNPLAPRSLKMNGELTFAIREAYSRSNPNQVLEFSYRPATKRLYYDNKSGHDPSELWVQVANLLQGS